MCLKHHFCFKTVYISITFDLEIYQDNFMCFDQRNRLRRFFFLNGILALRVEISKKHTILFKKLFQIIVVYIYVLNLEGLNTLFGFKACTYRISLVSFVSLFNSNSWHGFFFNYWFVLRLFFYLFFNTELCILYFISMFYL